MNLAALPRLLPGVLLERKSCCRLVAKKYAEQMENTAHAVLYEWRYNPKGEFGVLYLSSSSDCAYREKLKQVQDRAEDLPSLAVGFFDLHLQCLDVTDHDVRTALSIDLASLVHPTDFSVTHPLSREARRTGFDAIIAPSAIGGDCHSLVVFRDMLAPPSYCVLQKQTVRPYEVRK